MKTIFSHVVWVQMKLSNPHSINLNRAKVFSSFTENLPKSHIYSDKRVNFQGYFPVCCRSSDIRLPYNITITFFQCL